MDTTNPLKKTILSCCFLGAVSLGFQGCATQGVSHPASSAMPDDSVPVTAQTTKGLLNVKVSAIGSSKEAKSVVEQVQQAVQGQLTADGFLIESANPDVLVMLNADVTLFDRSGNYYVYDGGVMSSVKLAHDNRLLGKNSFTTRGKRRLDKQPALNEVASKLAPEVTPWVEKTAMRAQQDLVATDITLNLSWPTSLPWNKSQFNTYIHKVLKALGAMDGVVNTYLVSEDKTNRQFVVRAVYFRKYFPQGILNRLAYENKNLRIETGL